MGSRAMGAVFAAAIVVGGCGGGDGSGDATADAPAPSTTTSAITETTPPSPSVVEIEHVEDLPYFDDAPGLSTPVLDVFTPGDDGSWPVVVTFHPDSAMNTKSATASLARAIAEQGAVVINPTYGGRGAEGPRSAEIARTAVDQSTCAVWFAMEYAGDYGGDVSDIRLVGFSGGANMAAAVAMNPSDDDRRCSVPATDIAVSEVVVFEGDLTLGSGWDGAIRDDPSFYEDITVWSHIDGYAGGPIHVLVDSKTTIGISQVEEALDLRHPDGPIRDAWEAMGVIDEDRATLVQANTLFHELLLEAGHDSTLTTIDSLSHHLSDAAQAAIIDLLFGATDEASRP